jgi:uncharacterized cupin superfamily protein
LLGFSTLLARIYDMKCIKKTLTSALAVTTGMLSALSGCASTSGTFEVTPGTYRVTTTATASFGGQAKAAS